VPFALGYCLSYLFRVVNAVLAPDLVSELNLSAGDLGLLTATYFVTFAAFQLPLGVLLDRYGPRKIEAALLVFAALGAYLFSQGDSITALMIGRGLIGFGVSACLMAAFKAFTQWFQAHQLPMVNGIIMAAGGIWRSDCDITGAVHVGGNRLERHISDSGRDSAVFVHFDPCSGAGCTGLFQQRGGFRAIGRHQVCVS